MTASSGNTSSAMTLSHVTRAESIKLRSVRSTWALLGVGIVSVFLSGPINAVGVVMDDRANGRPPADFDAVSLSTSGLSTLLFFVATVGILQATHELSTGLGRTTFTAVPRRSMIATGKGSALALLSGPIVALAAGLSFAVTQLVLKTRDLNVSLFSGDFAQVVAGAAAAAIAFSLFGQALGWTAKNTVGGVFAVLGLVGMAGPLLELLLPDSLSNDIVPFLPAESAMAMISTDAGTVSLPGWAAVLVTAFWCLTALLWTVRVLRRRDT